MIGQRAQQFGALPRLLFNSFSFNGIEQETPEQILQTHARTSFSFAANFLPDEQRHGATVLYAFFRTVDDLVDERHDGGDRERVAGNLHAWRDWFVAAHRDAAPVEPLGSQLATVIGEYKIPTYIFLDLLDGLYADLEPRRIRDRRELDLYCYQVASTVGIAMAHVLGSTSDEALVAASQLGAAMQLTNILRDVGEDLEAGRVYLPASTLREAGIGFDDLLLMQRRNTGPDARFRDVMRGQVARAHELYDEGIEGIWLLPADCRLPILLASRLYRRLLDIIEAHEYDTLRNRVATSRFDKFQEAFICFATTTLGHRDATVAADHAPRGGHTRVGARRD